MVHQRSESGLTRPSGRIVHPQPVRRQAAPALRPVLPPRQRAPLPSGPSLLTTRCLRRHLRDYAPIRHPNAPQATAAVFPRRWPPAVTCRRAHPGFPGSDDLLACMMWSIPRRFHTALTFARRPVLPSATGTASARATTPFRGSIHTLHACCLRFDATVTSTRRKTRYGAPG